MASPTSDTLAQAEAIALKAEADERVAYERFDAMRAALKSDDKAHEATQHPEFRTWMTARVTTDEAWGRWALAMEETQE